MGSIDLLKIVDYIKIFVNERNDEYEKFFKEYISPAYEDIKTVYADIWTSLYEIEGELQKDAIDNDEAVARLKQARIPYQPLREELRSKVIVISCENKANKNLGMFAVGVSGVLQGGMVGKYFDNNQLMMNNYLNKKGNITELLFYEGNHAFVDLIKKYDKDSNWYIGKEVEMQNKSEQDIRNRFLDSLKKQRSSVEKYWKVVTFAYEEMRKDVYL